jgi:aryl-alcohol dehydrogenase-like predicted oxidoreductase
MSQAGQQAQLGLGTATLLAGYGLAASGPVAGAPLLAHALSRGVRYLDTAASYGASERVLGECHRLIAEAGARICAKLGASELQRGGFPDSCARMQVTSVDTLMLHSAPARQIADAASAAQLEQLKDDGLIRRGGASTYGTAAAQEALSQAWCDAVQVEHSILNPSVVRTIAPLRRPGQEVVVRSVLCKGLLTARRYQQAPAGADMALLDELEALAHSWSLSLVQLAIRFALDTPGVDVVLFGASSIAEVDEACAALAAAPLSGAQMDALGEFDRSTRSWTHPEQWATAPA